MKFNIYTLGCKVNTYESNVMIDALKNYGYEEVSIDSKADISIINTCTVTNTAAHKSIKIVKHAIRENPNAIIVVCGCLSQNQKELFEEMKDVDIIIGNVGKSKIVEYIKSFQGKQVEDVRLLKNVPFEHMQLNNFNKTRAFVKIQDGCNNFCTYCVIPYTRGNVRSKKREDVLFEVSNLVKSGHQEIVLTGIHTGNYGVELNNYRFSDLLEDLILIPGLKRIRISSIEITEINEKVLSVFQNSNILVDHIHIPLQSGCDSVLKRMNRKYDVAYFIKKIEAIRRIRPNISITTDVIVGFPGETEQEFEETIQTIQAIGFSKLHVFPYSKRNGTKAALLKGQLDGNLKKKRTHILLELSKQLEIAYMEKFIGETIEVLKEQEQTGWLIGHTGNYLCVKTKKQHQKNIYFVKLDKIAYPYMIGTIAIDEKIET